MNYIDKNFDHVMDLIAKIKAQLKIRYPEFEYFHNEVDKIEKAWKSGKITQISEIGMAAVQVIDDHTDQLANDLCELSAFVRSAYSEDKY